MSILKKSVGFIAFMAFVPSAFALTSRLGVVATASSRMPRMTTVVTSGTTTTTTSASLLENAECIDAYNACIKGADACGPNFEECTTKVLFHAQMPDCISTLAQCSANGITSLFGTSDISALSNVASKNSYGEITDYTYPTDGSVLGQMISAAAISNRYDTGNCVKRYTSCLKKESVCGNDFELCTTNSEFRRQMVLCDSTLARCQSEGKKELFGNATTTTPTATSRIGEMISEGAALAAVNAVSTCYKVIDQCILGACATNPYKCYEQATSTSVKLVDAINSGDENAATAAASASNGTSSMMLDVGTPITTSEIAGYIRGMCESTIGSNKYCYATFIGNGAMPTASQLSDEDNQAEVYDAAYSARMNNAMKARIQELVQQYDTKAKSKCTDTIKSCAMRVCGGGVGAACYSTVYATTNTEKSINGKNTYADIKTGCESIVNTDPYCKYAAENPNDVGTYTYKYVNGAAFDILFPEYSDSGDDPIGVVAALNASLATSYNDAAIAQMKRQCQSVATSCVKSLCGTDYQNCYRNRTDVYSNLTDTGNSTFDKSMNKVGGVLDYTIVLGLCLDTVKNASVCSEHLAIETYRLKRADNTTPSWGANGTVRDGWIDAGSATAITAETETVQSVDENGNNICTSKTGEQGVCYTVDASGNVFDQPVMISYTTYIESQAANSLFKDLIYDLEKEAQAKYNAKLTKEQNMCLALNNGGILGKSDTGSAYMWVKLKSNKVPANYTTNGLTTKQFVASNDLYGSFCRVRVTLQSDDKRIQDVINKGADWATAYFATGDPFTCGSWIPGSELEKIANAVANDATADKAASQKRTRTWLTVLGGLGSAVGGVALGESIRKGNILGGLTGLGDKTKNEDKNKDICRNNVTWALGYVKADPSSSDVSGVSGYKNEATAAAKQLGVDSAKITAVETAYTTWANSSDDRTGVSGLKADELKTALNDLSAECNSVSDKEDDEKTGGNKAWITAVSTAVTGAAGTVIVNRLVNDIQRTNLDSEKQAAYDEWMNNVGNHIQCYVGGDEIGDYGTTAVITLE